MLLISTGYRNEILVTAWTNKQHLKITLYLLFIKLIYRNNTGNIITPNTCKKKNMLKSLIILDISSADMGI
jgi:hypothetical protein